MAKVKKIFYILFIICFISPVFTAEPKTLKVGTFDLYPMCHSGEHFNDDKGLFINLFEEIAAIERWEYDYYSAALPMCLEMLKAGELDVVVAASYSKEMEADLDFTRETVISTWAQLYVQNRTAIRSYLDLSNKYIGVVGDDPYYQVLRETVGGLNIKCKFVEFKNYEDVLNAVSEKWIDAGVVDRLYAANFNHTLKIHLSPIVFSPVELRFAVKKNQHRKILNALDYNLSLMKQDRNSNYYMQLNNIFKVKEAIQIPKWAIWSSIAVFGLFFLACFMTIILRQQVKTKTAQLSHNNDKLRKEVQKRKNAEEAMQKSNALLRQTFASMHDMLLVIDNKGQNIMNCNRSASLCFGYSQNQLLKLKPDKLFKNKSYANSFFTKLEKIVLKRGFVSHEFEMKKHDGHIFPAEIIVTPIDSSEDIIYWVFIIRDISEKKALHESAKRLQQAQKMEAIGTLAGGIAHDFNNILMPIMGYAELIKMSSDGDEDQTFCIDQILQAARRAKALVKQILTFSRQKEQETEAINLSLSIQETTKLLRASLPSTIDIQIKIETDEDVVNADATQIHQVLMNLCTNASQAMKHKDGVLEVGLTNHFGGIQGWSLDKLIDDKEYVVLWVKDNGTGIPQHVMERVFDPFFTTKKQGEGTGMGLSVVHGIVNSYDGAISVVTEFNQGTIFYIYLPKSKTTQIESVEVNEIGPLGQSETIYFVDDEHMIVDMVERLLSNQGYNVVPFSSALDALEKFKLDPYCVNMVITDQTMPGMTGSEMAKEMLSIRSDLPIILCTGYSEALSPEQAKDIGILEYVMKPFVPREIADLIRKVLNSSNIKEPALA